MTRPCPGPRAVTSRPGWRAPPGAADCHMHIFGPYDRYPLSPGRGYTPPEASIAMYRDMLSTIGLERTVVVQPSIYGTDNAVTLDAVEALGRDRARAVVVVDDGVDAEALRAMGARGACGVRFNAVSGNGTPLGQLEALGERLKALGWHLQLYAHAAEMVALESVLARLPVPVVIDHMGGVQAAEGGVGNPGFRAMIRLLEKGAWAKLCGYRSSAGAPYADVAEMARAMIAAAPERCVWGTDWPHPSLHSPEEVPDDGVLLDCLGAWAPAEAQRQAILVDNSARLYGF
ncbi:amidohydrolase family protein [Paracraurococcus lichenis]|uniref:Amidohydrolase family protein n=1 Tax=Paracraurococcus lichenis TaxID=3064888 RepID=A0ABT9DXE9_9PROT|nr:amidohydrolase family protein [Paracraurococcus sp. LOR1-02]MDO9708578.1 amidohydrolase family protein [Paracraurococcus sp. LOR1-02]